MHCVHDSNPIKTDECLQKIRTIVKLYNHHILIELVKFNLKFQDPLNKNLQLTGVIDQLIL